MPSKIFGPRKRRTRQHVIADQSVHHVEGFILDEGHTAERIFSDYGYDLVMATFDERGYIEADRVFFQIKASDHLGEGPRHAYDLEIRDYNLWMHELNPVILVLYDAIRRRSYWQDIQTYFSEDEARRPKKGAKYVRVQIPESHMLNGAAIVQFRQLKTNTRRSILWSEERK